MKRPLLLSLSCLSSLVSCLFLSVAYAADRTCTKSDSANASKAIDAVVTWPQLRKAWADYRHCDSGEVADLYTDALLRLAVAWKNADQFAADAGKDPGYKAFVVEHLKSPAAKDDLPSIRGRLSSTCPKGNDAFCADLTEALKGAAAPNLNLAPLQPIGTPK